MVREGGACRAEALMRRLRRLGCGQSDPAQRGGDGGRVASRVKRGSRSRGV